MKESLRNILRDNHGQVARHGRSCRWRCTAPAKKSILGKLLVLGLVLAVVAVECTVAYLCIPTASTAAVAAGNAVKPPPDPKKGESDSAGGSEDSGTIEVDLKEFSVTIFQPASNSTLRIDFHLHGIVAREDEKDFKELFREESGAFSRAGQRHRPQRGNGGPE